MLLWLPFDCYTAVFSVIMQRSSPLTAAENYSTKASDVGHMHKALISGAAKHWSHYIFLA